MSMRTTVSDSIYGSLRRAILEQALKPGTKLAEEAIAETFGVSRTGVRGALTRLSADGLVDLRPNRGAMVAKPTLEEADDVFSVRRVLEAEVIRRLCRQMTDETLQALDAHVRKEDEAIRAGDTAQTIRLAGEFHLTLAKLTGSATLIGMISQVASRCSLILAQYGRPRRAGCGTEEHRALVRALAERDVETALGLMEAHLLAVEARARVTEEAEPDLTAILRRYAGAP